MVEAQEVKKHICATRETAGTGDRCLGSPPAVEHTDVATKGSSKASGNFRTLQV